MRAMPTKPPPIEKKGGYSPQNSGTERPTPPPKPADAEASAKPTPPKP